VKIRNNTIPNYLVVGDFLWFQELFLSYCKLFVVKPFLMLAGALVALPPPEKWVSTGIGFPLRSGLNVM
jgi:hypothetical protein